MKFIFSLLLIIFLIPMIHAEAPTYEIIPEIIERNGEKKINSLQVKINGMDLDETGFNNKCHPHSKLSTTCDIILIYQNEKIIQQNQEIIDLLTMISLEVRD